MEASRSLGRRTLADAAFDRLVRGHRVHLERYAVHLGASREDAEEIAATALLRAYQSPPEICCEREWRAWLSTVTRNLFFDARRRRQVRAVSGEGVLEALPSSAGSVDQLAAAAQEARQICAAIALLPPAQRAVIYLREVRGYSYEEISDELGLTVKAVNAALHSGRKKLQLGRGGLSGALSAMALSPLALLRRVTGAGRSAAAVLSTAKMAVPVMLIAGAGAGTAAIVTHDPARPASAATLVGAPLMRPSFTATPSLAALRAVPAAGSRRRAAGTQVRAAPLARDAEPPAVSHPTTEAGGGGAPTTAGTGSPATASPAAQPSQAVLGTPAAHAHGGVPAARGAGRGVRRDGAHPSKGSAGARRAAATSHVRQSPGKGTAATAHAPHRRPAPAERADGAAHTQAAPAAHAVASARAPAAPASSAPALASGTPGPASSGGATASADGSAAGSEAPSPSPGKPGTPPEQPTPAGAGPPPQPAGAAPAAAHGASQG